MADDVLNVIPADARGYLKNFGHSEDALKEMPDEDVVKLHGTVSQYTTGIIDDKTKNIAFGGKWRENIAGEDQEAMKTLVRFSDPGALWKSYNELRTKVSKGELKSNQPFPDKGTEQEQAAWRQEHNIPDKPESYDLALPDGLVIGEEDKPFVDSFLKSAHAANLSNEAVKANLGWYFGEYLPEIERERGEEDAEFRRESYATLQEKWGPDFKRNVESVKSLLMLAPESLRPRFWSGRLADGKAIGDDPEVLQFLAYIAHELNPASTLTGVVGGDTMKSIDGRIAEIEKVIRTDRKAYNKDEKMQQEYRDLLSAKEKIAAKAA